jgi:GNAT superfamily N-acetyltransferase
VTVTTTIELIGPDRLAELAEPLHQLYRVCFAEPPWNEPPEQIDGYPAVLSRDLVQPGIFALVAMDGPTLAAVVYGWPAPAHLPNEPVYRRLVRALPACDHHHLVAPALRVTELMVDPRYRRNGLARTLLGRFVAGQPSAWLSTHPQAPARSLYESTGWRALCQFTTGTGRPAMIYTRAVSAPSTGSTARTAVPLPSLR